MSKFAKFMKANKIIKGNEMHEVTASLCDENGKPLKWEFQHITSRENEDLKDECTIDVQVTGKPNMYRPKFKTSMYLRKLLVASIVMPNLYDAELQNSYGVKTPEDLLLAMVDNPGEYNDLTAYVQKFQGFDVSFGDKVKEAKN